MRKQGLRPEWEYIAEFLVSQKKYPAYQIQAFGTLKRERGEDFANKVREHYKKVMKKK